MKAIISVFVAGFLFAIGLGISGMTDANKVISFLNIANEWDPSLAFVMIGAIGIHLSLYRSIIRRPTPLFQNIFRIPTSHIINARLIIGSSIFGIGWGLGGFCPGPGLVSGITFSTEVIGFLSFMLIGMLLFHRAQNFVQKRKQV